MNRNVQMGWITLLIGLISLSSCLNSPTHELNAEVRVQLEELLMILAGNPKEEYFQQALQYAKAASQESGKELVPTFLQRIKQLDPNLRLGVLFSNEDLDISVMHTDHEVANTLIQEWKACMEYSAKVLEERMEQMTGHRPEVEIRGDKIFIRAYGSQELLQEWETLFKQGKLAIAQTFSVEEFYPILISINDQLREEGRQFKDFPALGGGKAALASPLDTTSSEYLHMKFEKENPLFSLMLPTDYEQLIANRRTNPVAGYQYEDSIAYKTRVSNLFQEEEIRNYIPEGMKFLWGSSPKDFSVSGTESLFWELICIREDYDGKYAMEDMQIEEVYADVGNIGDHVVVIGMGEYSARDWARLTEANIGRSLAILIDEEVYSYPIVNEAITGGRTQISGGFSELEAEQFAAVLGGGSLPTSMEILSGKVISMK